MNVTLQQAQAVPQIKNEAGRIIGAVGASGSTADVAKAGLKALDKQVFWAPGPGKSQVVKSGKLLGCTN